MLASIVLKGANNFGFDTNVSNGKNNTFTFLPHPFSFLTPP